MIKQVGLFGAAETNIRSKIIARKSDFDGLFDGFNKLRAISYVVSPDLLLEFFDKRGYTEVEVCTIPVGDHGMISFTGCERPRWSRSETVSLSPFQRTWVLERLSSMPATFLKP